MIKKNCLVLITLLTLNVYAQQRGTASPYSFFGIGNFIFEGTAENRGMGGLSIYTDSIHFNFRNPASYGGNKLRSLNGESRPVKFTVGGSSSSINLESSTGSDKTNTATFDYLGFSFPIGKLGIGFGLLPFTSVGYELEALDDQNRLNNQFSGDGGVNRAFLGLGYQITKNLSLGIDFNYNFGRITNNSVEFLFAEDGTLLQNQSREINESDLTGFSYNIGLTYKPMLTENLQLTTAATFSPKSDLKSDNERTFATIVFNQTSGAQVVINQIEADLDALGLRETDLTIPTKATFGLGIGKQRKWFVGAEYTFLKASEFSNRTFEIDNTSFEDASKFAIGGFFIPQYNSFGYWKRIVFRAGLNYEKTGLIINNESIEEFGISFGLGLPVGPAFSNANISVELGQRGTTNQNLVQENFVNVQLSLSLNDRWFRKRKFK
ncbi:hypothetical protein D7030_00180 [Flavobacteriaceae bacterium AU392]|nr:hypothetical protein D1817_14255 [Flavobacteriaceae bacterium]RKM86950.1 hypothetical protein D7030_00180 [Flavobacteriaceae bacterium AU392]